MPAAADRRHSLPDGTTVRIRDVRNEDADRVLAMLQRVTADSLHSRFFGLFTPDPDSVRPLIDTDPARGFTLVATLGYGDAERIVGLARYDRLSEEPQTGEFSVMVEDAHQGRGIGTTLIRALGQAALDHGIRRFTGDILRGNVRMLRLVTDLGLTPVTEAEGRIIHTTFELQPTDDYLAAVARDEKQAAQAALQRFFHPRRVAVVGASRDRTTIGGLVFANILAGGFTGAVYPVNPAADAIQSVTAYPDLTSCPAVPDLVVVCVPAPVVPGVVEEAGRLGVRAVCIISAGFAEVGAEGAALQQEVMDRAHGAGLRVIGPNCMGLLNAGADVRLNATFSQVLPRPGKTGFMSQSGALGLSALRRLEELGLGMSTFVSVGNKADVSGNDLLLYWEDDPETDVALLYLESFGNPRRFARIARRITRRKPIVAVKAGRTPAGQRAASSHTAALAAGEVAVDALFRQSGVIRTDTLEEMLGVAAVLSSQPPPPGRRVAIVTNGGGPGTLAADACESEGLEVPQLAEATTSRLQAFLPAQAAIGNPVDMIASSTAEQYAAAVRVLAEAPEIDAVVAIFIPPMVTRTEDVAEALVAARAAMPPDKPLVTVFMDVAGVPEPLTAARIPSFHSPEESARALGRVARWAAWCRRPQGAIATPQDVRPQEARAVVEQALDGTAEAWLSWEETRAVLEAYGIPLARAAVVGSPEEAAVAQRQMGSPVAVKVAAPIHKADVGGVQLGLASPDAAAQAVESIRRGLSQAGLAEHGAAFIVQEMVTDGVELVAGVTHDPNFGPLVMVGLGGTLVELLQDVAVRVTPLTDVDIEEMLTSLRTYPLLTGYRGSPPRDVDACRELLARVSTLVEDLPQTVELDLNPVFVLDKGVVAVDARLKVRG